MAPPRETRTTGLRVYAPSRGRRHLCTARARESPATSRILLLRLLLHGGLLLLHGGLLHRGARISIADRDVVLRGPHLDGMLIPFRWHAVSGLDTSNCSTTPTGQTSPSGSEM